MIILFEERFIIPLLLVHVNLEFKKGKRLTIELKWGVM